MARPSATTMRQFVWGADFLGVYEIVYAMSIETDKNMPPGDVFW